MPGTVRHLCLLLEEEGVLFSGDNVVGLGTTAIPPPPQGDMRLYLESLKRMLALDARIVCPGHGPIVHQPAKKIQELIDHRRERDEQVLGLISQGKDSLGEIVRGIYPELDPRLEPAARGQVLSHLYKLRDEGRVSFQEEAGEVRCRLTVDSTVPLRLSRSSQTLLLADRIITMRNRTESNAMLLDAEIVSVLPPYRRRHCRRPPVHRRLRRGGAGTRVRHASCLR
jgi:hypothetical protein